MELKNDGELVLGCLRGEAASWEMFVDRFARLVHWSIRRALEGTPFKARADLCEDIFQEFFKRLIERGELSRLRETVNVRKFLSVSAIHLTLDRVKSLSRYEKSFKAETVCLSEDPGKDAARHEALFLVQAVVEDLDEKERVCLELHYLDGKSHREIGEILALPQDTVSTVIRRTREKMRQRLLEKGLEEA